MESRWSDDHRRGYTMYRIRLVTAASKWTIARAREFGSNRSGSVMIVGAIVLPILFLVAGMAVDYGSASSSATRLQEMADAAAIAAAKELVLANADEDQLQSVAQLSIDTNVEANPSDVLDSIRVKASVSASAGTVSVKLSAMHNNVFGGFLNPPKMQIIRHSTAQALGGVKLCILGLHRSENGAIRLEQNAKITANGCAVYSNSRHGNAIINAEGDEIGIVTSGTQSPILSKGVGMGYVPNESQYTSPGSVIGISSRGKAREAIVTKPPFHKA